MRLRLNRRYCKKDYTIGELTHNGQFVCNILEPPVGDLNKNGKFDNGEKKVKGHTAIPYGTYEITLDVFSPRFGNQPFYRELCNGKLPRLLNVPEFDGVLIHAGNKVSDTAGCLLTGLNTIKGQVTSSRDCLKKVYRILYGAKMSNDRMYIEIV